MVKLPLSRNAKSFLLIFCIQLFAYSPLLLRNARSPDAAVILPPLFEVSSPLEYIRMLGNFEVIDFQPMRDLTFFVDILIFKLTHIVTFATTNVILWSVAVWLLFLLLDRLVSGDKRNGSILWALAFGVYPLFSQAVAWGMARKHILAFVFILWAIHAFMDWCEKKGTLLKSYILFVLAALSHPIVCLWPVWAYLYHREERKKLIPFFLTTGAILFTNYAYYTIGNSNVLSVYGNARPDYSPVRLLTNFAFYFREIIFPYRLTFFNIPDPTSIATGALTIIALGIFIFTQRKKQQTWAWVCLMLLPFPIFLQLIAIFDQYLLIPAAAILILLFLAFHRSTKFQQALLVTLVTGWGIITFTEARAWTDLSLITERNFENGPSCISAAEYMMERYTEGKRATPELLDFFYRHECLQPKPNATSLSQQLNLILESLILFYESDSFPREQRIERLQELGGSNYYPSLVLAAVFAQENNAQAVEQISSEVLMKSGGMKLETGPLMETVLRPYCLSHQLTACLEVTDMITPDTPYL